MTMLLSYIEALAAEGIVVDLVRMNPPPEEGIGVTVEVYPEPQPFIELFAAGMLVQRVVPGR